MPALFLVLNLALLAPAAHAQDGGEARAVSGAPFLAYVGDSINLSAEWSTGPEPLTFQWTQIEGPPVQLDDPTSMRPRFTAAAEGTHAFEVVVGEGSSASEPALALVHVVGPDLHRGQGQRDQGCASVSWGWGWLALLVLPLTRRRR